MTTQDKLALGLEHGMGVVEYGLCRTYEELVRTWRDEREIPSEEQILEWFDECPANQPDYSHLVIHAAQLREMLRRRGIKEAVEAMIASVPGMEGDVLRDWYAVAPNIRFDSPKVEMVRSALVAQGMTSLTKETLAEWFAVAMTYE